MSDEYSSNRKHILSISKEFYLANTITCFNYIQDVFVTKKQQISHDIELLNHLCSLDDFSILFIVVSEADKSILPYLINEFQSIKYLQSILKRRLGAL